MTDAETVLHRLKPNEKPPLPIGNGGFYLLLMPSNYFVFTSFKDWLPIVSEFTLMMYTPASKPLR